MSLIIKGMEMPKCCAWCDLEHWDEDAYGDETNHRCALYYKGYTAKVRETGRLPDCPLVPLPEKYGRLIDVQALKGDIDGFIECMTKVCAVVDGEMLWGKLLDALENAPTIVPAEGGGESE